MFKKIAGLFGKRPAVVKGTGKLQEGHSKVVSFGDVLAGTGVQVMISRLNGELMAIDAICPHQGVLMEDGPLTDGKFVVCPLHLYHFNPKTGAERSAQCRNAQSYKVREVGDDAEIWL
jgi:nitrite reductase/ring-hydroxylating ferredoxin subunit